LQRYLWPGAPDVPFNDRDAAKTIVEKVNRLLKASRRRELCRKARFFVLVVFVPVVLLLLVGMPFFELQVRRQAEMQRHAADLEAARVDQLLQDITQSSKTLRQTSEQLQQLALIVAAKAPASEISDQIAQAQKSVEAQADTLATVGQQAPPPRVYIHISDEGQRPVAQQLAKKLEQVRIGNAPVVVPGVPLVKSSDSKSVLRCFRSEECQTDGPLLVHTINGLLTTPDVTLEDLTGRYSQSTDMPRHFELWFGPGQIALAPGR
jgi:hypothetical protein